MNEAHGALSFCVCAGPRPLSSRWIGCCSSTEAFPEVANFIRLSRICTG